MVAHTFNSSTWESEAGMNLRPVWSSKWVPGPPGPCRNTLFCNPSPRQKAGSSDVAFFKSRRQAAEGADLWTQTSSLQNYEKVNTWCFSYSAGRVLSFLVVLGIGPRVSHMLGKWLSCTCSPLFPLWDRALLYRPGSLKLLVLLSLLPA